MTRITRPALIAFDFEVEGSERCRVCLRTIVMCPQCCVGRECFAIASCVARGRGVRSTGDGHEGGGSMSTEKTRERRERARRTRYCNIGFAIIRAPWTRGPSRGPVRERLRDRLGRAGARAC